MKDTLHGYMAVQTGGKKQNSKS